MFGVIFSMIGCESENVRVSNRGVREIEHGVDLLKPRSMVLTLTHFRGTVLLESY